MTTINHQNGLSGPVNIVWFKRDLRLQDHRPLVEAARHGRVLAIYIVEPGYWKQPDTSGRQWMFTREAIESLAHDLAEAGGSLVIRTGDAATVFSSLLQGLPVSALWSHEETGNGWTFKRDREVAEVCATHGIAWHECPQHGVRRGMRDRDEWLGFHASHMGIQPLRAPTDITFADAVSDPLPAWKDLSRDDDPCPLRQQGGRARAMALLDSFFAGRGRTYTADMSSPLTAEAACSRLSPHLAAGTLSVRQALHRCAFERAKAVALPATARTIELRSIDSLMSRLHWHCHFIQKLESEPAIEWQSMHAVMQASRRPTPQDDPALTAFATGRTGFPFVDACMRCLHETGWINFRMRAMLTAFATYHLERDWHAVGIVLARLFTDYEPGIHWPQVQMQSGATGINTPRIYNPVKQSCDQDPNGVFIRRWIPELAGLPTALLHEPWKMGPAEQILYGVELGKDYPQRLIDHVEAMRAARVRLSAIRAGAGFAALQVKVYGRHGSRKRNLKDDHPERSRAIRAARKQEAQRQFSFDL